jgi:hypothetical protein
MRWTRQCCKTNDTDRGRRSRVVLTPRRWRQVATMLAHCAYDGGKRARSSRRARRKPLKPLRGECRVISGVTVVTCSCAFYFAREAAGAIGAPGIPCALRFLWAKIHAHLGRKRAAGSRRHVPRVPGAAPHEQTEMMRCRTRIHSFRGTNRSRLCGAAFARCTASGTRGSRFCEAALHAASRPGPEEVAGLPQWAEDGRTDGRSVLAH